jgi:aminoglycoside 6'-N-acetyltransferase I
MNCVRPKERKCRAVLLTATGRITGKGRLIRPTNLFSRQMNISTSIEKIGGESLDVALHLLRRFFSEEGFDTPAEEIRSSLAAMLASANSAVFLARRGEEVQGIATVTTSVGIEYGLAAEMDDLYVLPRARGKGIASALIEAVCAWCREQGCTTVLVTVTPEGEAAHGLVDFYQRRSFANTGRVILERNLSPRTGKADWQSALRCLTKPD